MVISFRPLQRYTFACLKSRSTAAVLGLFQASSGLVPTTDYLQTLAAYENETNYTVWNDVNGKVANLFILLWNDDEAHEHFKKFSLKLFKKIADRLGWEPKTDESRSCLMWQF